MKGDGDGPPQFSADIQEFIEAYDRPPNLVELLRWREARASVALDKGDDGTFVVEGAHTGPGPKD